MMEPCPVCHHSDFRILKAVEAHGKTIRRKLCLQCKLVIGEVEKYE